MRMMADTAANVYPVRETVHGILSKTGFQAVGLSGFQAVVLYDRRISSLDL